jgi:hypothetical protein
VAPNSGTPATVRAAILIVPPRGIASRALMTMLRIAVSNWLGSASTRCSAFGQVVSMVTDEPIVLPMIRCRPRRRAPTSKTSGCRGWRRAKARSCPVRVAARSAVSAIASM